MSNKELLLIGHSNVECPMSNQESTSHPSDKHILMDVAILYVALMYLVVVTRQSVFYVREEASRF